MRQHYLPPWFHATTATQLDLSAVSAIASLIVREEQTKAAQFTQEKSQ